MDLDSAIERLYTDESLAADVDDSTAKPLLKWAEAMLPPLLARGEEQFEADFVTFKKLIKSIARLIDLRGELDVSERAERAEKIQTFAQALGLNVDVNNLDAMAQFDGPSLVAQMVGPAEAAGEPVTPQANSDTRLPAQLTTTEDARTTPEQTHEHESPVTAAEEPMTPQAADGTVLPVQLPAAADAQTPPETTQVDDAPAPEDEPNAGSPVDGIGTFFQRLFGRSDDAEHGDIDESNNKE